MEGLGPLTLNSEELTMSGYAKYLESDFKLETRDSDLVWSSAYTPGWPTLALTYEKLKKHQNQTSQDKKIGNNRIINAFQENDVETSTRMP